MHTEIDLKSNLYRSSHSSPDISLNSSLKTCHQLLISFLSSYPSLLGPFLSKYSYIDDYITILYSCVEIYRISGHMVQVVEMTSEFNKVPFDSGPVGAELAHLNLEALSLLRLLKELISNSSDLDEDETELLKSHMSSLVLKSKTVMRVLMSHIVPPIVPPFTALDSRVLSGLLSEWISVNKSMQDSLEKQGFIPLSMTKKYHSNTHSDANGDHFTIIKELLIEMDRIFFLDKKVKLCLVEGLHHCSDRNFKLLETLLELLFELRNESNVNLRQVCRKLAQEAQQMLSDTNRA